MRVPRKAYKRPVNPERAEAFRKFNETQEWRGQCRRCKVHWVGFRKEIPVKCTHCGFPDGA